LIGAIEKSQSFLKKNPQDYVWRADIKKFFDNVDQPTLIRLIERKITDPNALKIIREVVASFPQGGILIPACP
jgi:retron-type reverse transcriptase